MKVNVISTVGTSTPMEYDVTPAMTVRELLEKVATSQAIDANAIQLLRNGQSLDMDRTMRDCGVRDGETLKAMPKNASQGF